MSKPKKKIVNFRLILCLAIAMIIAVVLACRVFTTQSSRLILTFILLAVLVVFILLAIKLKRVYVNIISILIALIIPVVSVYIKANKINQNFSLNAESCEIYGKIYKISKNLDNNRVDIYLTNVDLISEEKELKFYGNYLLRVNLDNFDLSKLEIGRYISCNTSPRLFSLDSNDEFERSYLSRDIMGTSYVFAFAVHVSEEYDLSLRDKIKSRVYHSFEKTDLFFTGVGYAMLFGDTSLMEDSVYEVFELSGTVHLLAVSGFHVTIIVAFLLFILKKLKANNVLSFMLTMTFLVFYAYLCNFSASVVRASIMSLIALFASMRAKECDRFSSMAIAAILILLINPLDLFNISFVLSFVSVLSIILLLPIFERLFTKFMHDKLASSLALTLSTSIGLTIYQLYYFGKAPMLSFISNIVTIPIVSMLFIFLIIALLVGSLFGLAVPLIELFGFGIKYVLQFNNWVAQMGLYLTVEHVREITLLLSIILMYSVSDYLFIKKKNRLILSGCLMAIILSLLIF